MVVKGKCSRRAGIEVKGKVPMKRVHVDRYSRPDTRSGVSILAVLLPDCLMLWPVENMTVLYVANVPHLYKHGRETILCIVVMTCIVHNYANVVQLASTPREQHSLSFRHHCLYMFKVFVRHVVIVCRHSPSIHLFLL